jgi:signal transduction histidine kinase
LLERKRNELMLFLAKMNRGLSDRQKELHAVGEIKTLLLGTVAHDLRNPLSVILNRSELIQNLLEMPQADVDRIKASCVVIEQSVEGMQRLISATLAQAASEAARIKIDTREFDARHAVEMAIALNQASADAKSITIEVKIEETFTIRGDEDRIVEALDNLIGNAIKYSYPDSRITVGVRKTSDMVELFVKDRGQGLTPEDRSRAFRHFGKLSARPTAGEASTGLGLAIVKAIALAHGGDVSIVSAGRNRGAKFIITLPA